MTDYENLKKKYGENFAKFCRANFSTLLEQEGFLSKIIEANFAPSKSLYDDIISQNKVKNFVNYINSFATRREEENNNKIYPTPEELLAKVGYTLYKCETNEDVLKFKKYYKSSEELCTFRDPYRIENYHIFFAVKNNVDKIKREDFKNPERQDEYGTSVISLQFQKNNNGYLSIKNRYNHTVINPDATFSNNLENITSGLTASFEQHYGLKVKPQNETFELKEYTCDAKGKFYKYNYEIDNTYYCANNIVIKDGVAQKIDKNRFELIDYFLIDKQNKTIKCLVGKDYDTFPLKHKNIEKIEITKITGNEKIETNADRLIKITMSDAVALVTVDKNNRIVEYKNDGLITVEDRFLLCGDYLKKFSAPNLIKIGNDFLYDNDVLFELDTPKLERVGDYFLLKSNISTLNLPNLKVAGNKFIGYGTCLHKLYAPKLEIVGNYFLESNSDLFELNLPSLKVAGNGFMDDVEQLEDIYLPELEKAGSDFLSQAKHIKKLDLPKLKIMNNNSLYCAFELEELNVPSVVEIENNCLYKAYRLKEINLNSVKKIGHDFCYMGASLNDLYVPNLESVGECFMFKNKTLRSLNAPKLKVITDGFLKLNTKLKRIQTPSLLMVEDATFHEGWLKSNWRAQFKMSYIMDRNIKKLKRQEKKELENTK